MANHEHLEKLRAGVKEWNVWRPSNLTSRPDLSRMNFRAAVLSGVNMSGAILNNSDLSNALLDGADLRGANLSDSNLSSAILTKATMAGVVFTNAVLIDANLQNANVRVADFRNAKLMGADLRNSDLSRANLKGADLSRANLSYANLNDTNLSGAILTDANLTGATLYGSNLSSATLNNTILNNREGSAPANFGETNLKGIVNSPFGNPQEDKYGYFLDLSTTLGLATARFSDGFLANYISEAFAYAHNPNLLAAKESLDFLHNAIQKMNFIQQLYGPKDIPSELVGVVNMIYMESSKFVKSQPGIMDNLQSRPLEKLITEILASHGWETSLSLNTKNNGCDIFAVNRVSENVNQPWIVECKLNSDHKKVDVDVVHAMFKIEDDFKLDGMLLATTSCFESGANAAKTSNYDLHPKDHESILKWIEAFH